MNNPFEKVIIASANPEKYALVSKGIKASSGCEVVHVTNGDELRVLLDAIRGENTEANALVLLAPDLPITQNTTGPNTDWILARRIEGQVRDYKILSEGSDETYVISEVYAPEMPEDKREVSTFDVSITTTLPREDLLSILSPAFKGTAQPATPPSEQIKKKIGFFSKLLAAIVAMASVLLFFCVFILSYYVSHYAHHLNLEGRNKEALDLCIRTTDWQTFPGVKIPLPYGRKLELEKAKACLALGEPQKAFESLSEEKNYSANNDRTDFFLIKARATLEKGISDFIDTPGSAELDKKIAVFNNKLEEALGFYGKLDHPMRERIDVQEFLTVYNTAKGLSLASSMKFAEARSALTKSSNMARMLRAKKANPMCSSCTMAYVTALCEMAQGTNSQSADTALKELGFACLVYERMGLSWPEKNDAMKMSSKPIERALDNVASLSKNSRKTEDKLMFAEQHAALLRLKQSIAQSKKQ